MLQPLANRRMITVANRLPSTNFKLIRKNRVVYTGKNNKYILKLDDLSCFKSLSCNCSNFLKSAVFVHVIAYTQFNNLNYYSRESNSEEQTMFVQKKKKDDLH